MKLGLVISLPGGDKAWAQKYIGEKEGWLTVQERVSGCKFSATRRAIVRAAAEIGKGIPQPAIEGVPEDNYYKTQAEAEKCGRAAAEIGRQMEEGAA